MKVEDLEIGRLYEHSYDGRVKLVSIESEHRVKPLKRGRELHSNPIQLVRTWAERERQRRAFDERRDDLITLTDDLRDALVACDINAVLRNASVGRPGTSHARMQERHTITVEMDHGAAALLAEMLRHVSAGRSEALMDALGLAA